MKLFKFEQTNGNLAAIRADRIISIEGGPDYVNVLFDGTTYMTMYQISTFDFLTKLEKFENPPMMVPDIPGVNEVCSMCFQKNVEKYPNHRLLVSGSCKYCEDQQ